MSKKSNLVSLVYLVADILGVQVDVYYLPPNTYSTTILRLTALSVDEGLTDKPDIEEIKITLSPIEYKGEKLLVGHWFEGNRLFISSLI